MSTILSHQLHAQIFRLLMESCARQMISMRHNQFQMVYEMLNPIATVVKIHLVLGNQLLLLLLLLPQLVHQCSEQTL